MAVMMSAIMQAPEAPFPAPSSHTPGDIITWDNKEWLVCHYDSSNNQVYLIAKDIVSKTEFGMDASYYGSRLAFLAYDYQNNQMSAAALNMLVDTTINGVTAKVFIPSFEQMRAETYPEQGLSWFNSNAHRIANYNGSAYYYWTSTKMSGSNDIRYITDSGGFYQYPYQGATYGFRPCICVQL